MSRLQVALLIPTLWACAFTVPEVAAHASRQHGDAPQGDWDGLAHARLEPPFFKAQWAREHGWGAWAPRDNWDPDSTGYDALHVDLLVEPLIAEEAIDGRVAWTVLITEAEVTSLRFDFLENLEITAATIGGLPVPFTRGNEQLALHLPACPSPGDTIRAEIAYNGQPELGFIWGFDFRYHNGVPIAYTNCEPLASHTWWPCKDRPDDKFTADLSFIVPDTLIAVSNGILVETLTLEGNRTLYHWRERYPITPYLVSLVATNFATFEDTYVGLTGTEMPLTYYAYPEDLERAMQDWAFTPQAITFFAQTFGEYPFIDEKYGMAEYPWSGAMEHQTVTSMGAYFLQLPEASDWVVVHELAHQWWGDWVTCGTWRDIWLNEGFAVYCEALWAEHLGGPDSLRSVMMKKASDHFPGSVYDPNFIFNSTVYRKGAWVLHMLRGVMGDEAFFEALRIYGSRHAYDSAVTEDLQAVLEEVYGQPLDWFFEPWVYGEGQPRYRVVWDILAYSITGPCTVLIDINQETTGPDYFKMPLDARFVLEGGEEFWTVLWDSLPDQQFLVTVPAVPESLQIDPLDWVLGPVLFVAGPGSASVDGSDHFGEPMGLDVTLGAPRPNPMHLLTAIPVRLSPSAAVDPTTSPDCLELGIYDATGRLVRLLEITPGPSPECGLFLWDGQSARGDRAGAGVYFVRLRGAGLLTPQAQSKRLLLLR